MRAFSAFYAKINPCSTAGKQSGVCTCQWNHGHRKTTIVAFIVYGFNKVETFNWTHLELVRREVRRDGVPRTDRLRPLPDPVRRVRQDRVEPHAPPPDALARRRVGDEHVHQPPRQAVLCKVSADALLLGPEARRRRRGPLLDVDFPRRFRLGVHGEKVHVRAEDGRTERGGADEDWCCKNGTK